MNRRVIVLHAWYDGGWAQRAQSRLHEMRWPTLCVPLTADAMAQVERVGVSPADVIVTVLSRALLADARAQSMVADIVKEAQCHRMTVVMDQDLKRRLPIYLEHIYAFTPVGDAIATLITKLQDPIFPAPRPRYGVGLIASLVLLVAVVGTLVLGVIITLVVPRLPSTDALAAAPGEPPPAVADEPPPVTTAPEDSPPTPPIPPPSAEPDPETPAHLEVQELRMTGAGSIRLRYLEGGSFTMGDARRKNDAALAHPVSVSGFWIGETEVTQAQWTAVMGANPSEVGGGIGDELPVQNATWNQVIGFLNRLSESRQYTPCYAYLEDQWQWNHECDGFRLPTEAEWEYAARAGTTTDYPHGNDMNVLCRYGNVSDRTAKRVHASWPSARCDDGFLHLAPVKSRAPNPWHLYDMHGNAAEWGWDRYSAYPAGPTIDPTGPDKGKNRVVRGGSYITNADGARSSSRGVLSPRQKNGRTGLRIARSEPARPRGGDDAPRELLPQHPRHQDRDADGTMEDQQRP